MPQTTAERAARWPGGDDEAIAFLEAADYKLNHASFWQLPHPDHTPTMRERDAVIYLIEEWDFGGILPADKRSELERRVHSALSLAATDNEGLGGLVKSEDILFLRIHVIDREGKSHQYLGKSKETEAPIGAEFRAAAKAIWRRIRKRRS